MPFVNPHRRVADSRQSRRPQPIEEHEVVKQIPEAPAEHAPMWALSELAAHQWTPQNNLMEVTSGPRAYERGGPPRTAPATCSS